MNRWTSRKHVFNDRVVTELYPLRYGYRSYRSDQVAIEALVWDRVPSQHVISCGYWVHVHRTPAYSIIKSLRRLIAYYTLHVVFIALITTHCHWRWCHMSNNKWVTWRWSIDTSFDSEWSCSGPKSRCSVLDQEFGWTQHIAWVTSSCFYQLRRLRISDFAGIEKASLFQLILIPLSCTLISFMPIFIFFIFHLTTNKQSLICSTFFGTVNHLHFTLLFVFISSRYHVLFSFLPSHFISLEQMLRFALRKRQPGRHCGIHAAHKDRLSAPRYQIIIFFSNCPWYSIRKGEEVKKIVMKSLMTHVRLHFCFNSFQ